VSPAWSTELADRIREQLAGREVVEKPMFGSLCFMVDGAMLACASSGAMLARLSEADRDAALAAGLGRPMVVRGREARHYAYLDEDALQDEDVFLDWLGRAIAFHRSLPGG
jgi:TfoX/Sxy family transcriptional regulator of competence genes